MLPRYTASLHVRAGSATSVAPPMRALQTYAASAFAPPAEQLHAACACAPVVSFDAGFSCPPASAKQSPQHLLLSATHIVHSIQEKGTFSFKGRERYRSNTWNQDALADYTTKVTSMQMRDSQTAQIQWAWRGQLAMFALSADVTSTLSLNQLTGKVLDHEDDVRLQGNIAGQLLYRLRKRVWAARQGASAVSSRVCPDTSL